MITRRQFLIGTAAGLILPDWLLKAEQYLRNEINPLLETPKITNDILTAVDEGNRYKLYLNYEPDPHLSSTWRERIERYDLANGESFDDYDLTLALWGYHSNLLEKLDNDTSLAIMLEGDGPAKKVYELLEKLNIGSVLTDGQHVGQLIPSHDMMSSNYEPIVFALDEITLSLLQKKLNDLNAGVSVVVKKLQMMI